MRPDIDLTQTSRLRTARVHALGESSEDYGLSVSERAPKAQATTWHLAVRYRVSGTRFPRLQESTTHPSDFGNLVIQEACLGIANRGHAQAAVGGRLRSWRPTASGAPRSAMNSTHASSKRRAPVFHDLAVTWLDSPHVVRRSELSSVHGQTRRTRRARSRSRVDALRVAWLHYASR